MGSSFRKIVLSFLIISILLGACSCKKNDRQDETTTTVKSSKYEVSDFDDANEEQMKTYLSLAETAAKNYYKAVIAGKEKFPDFPLAVSADCKQYIKLKLAYDTKANEKARKFLGGFFEAAEYEIVDDKLVCGLIAEVSFRYLDSDETQSFAEEVQIVIENPQKPTIIDWYVNDPESFDGQLRGDDLSLLESANWLINKNVEEILNKGKELADKNK